MKIFGLFLSLLCISQISFCSFDDGERALDYIQRYGKPENFQRYDTKVGELHLIMLLRPLAPEHKLDQLIQKFIKREGLSTRKRGIIVGVEQGTWGIPKELGFPNYIEDDGRSPQGLVNHGGFVGGSLIHGNGGIIYQYRTRKEAQTSCTIS